MHQQKIKFFCGSSNSKNDISTICLLLSIYMFTSMFCTLSVKGVLKHISILEILVNKFEIQGFVHIQAS